MEKLYDRADIYDLLENGSRYEITKGHWQYLLKGKPVRSLLDVSIGSGNMTLPVLDLGIDLYGSDLSEAMLSRCDKKQLQRGTLSICNAVTSGKSRSILHVSSIALPAPETALPM